MNIDGDSKTKSGSGSAEGAGDAAGARHAVRAITMQKLAGVQERLGSSGISAEFLRAAKNDPVGDTGVMGSVLFHGLLMGPFDAFLADMLPYHADLLAGHLHDISAIGEGLSALRETAQEQAQRQRGIRSAFYPLGRRKADKLDKKKSRKGAKSRFNRAANQNRHTREQQAELGHMFDLMDSLHALEREGATEDRQEVRFASVGATEKAALAGSGSKATAAGGKARVRRFSYI